MKILTVAAVAALLGFAAGWYVRAELYPSAEDKLERAKKDFERGLNELKR
jgi:hypothetical protein